MNRPPLRSTIVCTLLIVLLVTAGCLGDGGQEDLPDSEAVADSLRSVEAIEATIQMQLRTGNETTEMTMDLIRRTGTGEFRASMTQGPPARRVEMVSNGTTMWVYNRSNGQVSKVRIDGLRSDWNRSVRSISGIFDSLRRSSDEDVSISPLPVVPGGGSSGNVGIGSFPAMGNVSMTYRDTGTVDGRTAYVVDLQPRGNDSVVTNATIWFDAERYLPIKAEYAMSVGGQARRVSIEYHNLTYNPAVPTGTFEFEPPDNATVPDQSSSLAVYQTKADLENATDMSVPDPELSAAYSFAQASTATNGDNRSLALQYSNGSGTVVVSKQTGPAARLNTTRGEAIDVGGQEGMYRERRGTRSVTWTCDGAQYAVTGSLAKAELLTIAESMVCE